MRSNMRRGQALRSVALAFAAVASIALWACTTPVRAQVISSLEMRPFVVGWIPVIGPRGGVGGVSVDAQGVVTKSEPETLERLREVRHSALKTIDTKLDVRSPLRKISLRGLQAAMERRRSEGLPATDELQNLAGLVRVQFVFVYPDYQDIVLAGPAEGWKIDALGNVVGQTTGQPVLQLDDLIVAVRTAKSAAAGEPISCSIDPTEEGLERLARVLSPRDLTVDDSTVAQLEQALGPQRVALTGIPPGSHFAHVLVAADYMLKRLGMKLEPAPIGGLPSYLDLLEASSSTAPRGAAIPRFWMAPNYKPLLKDKEGLAWQLRGPGVQTLAESSSSIGATAAAKNRLERDPAQIWARAMTARYEALSAALPAFAELRNCMDLAVVAALLVKEDLPGKSDCDLSLVSDEKRVQIAAYHVPHTVESRASLIKKGRQWIVGVSGGVEVDSWSVLERVEVHPSLAGTRAQSTPAARGHWWWD